MPCSTRAHRHEVTGFSVNASGVVVESSICSQSHHAPGHEGGWSLLLPCPTSVLSRFRTGNGAKPRFARCRTALRAALQPSKRSCWWPKMSQRSPGPPQKDTEDTVSRISWLHQESEARPRKRCFGAGLRKREQAAGLPGAEVPLVPALGAVLSTDLRHRACCRCLPHGASPSQQPEHRHAGEEGEREASLSPSCLSRPQATVATMHRRGGVVGDLAYPFHI